MTLTARGSHQVAHRRMLFVVLGHAIAEVAQHRGIVRITADLGRFNHAVVSVGRRYILLPHIEAFRVLTLLDGLDAAPDEAAEHDDPTILRPEMLERKHVDRTLAHLRIVISRDPLPLRIGADLILAEQLELAALLERHRFALSDIADEEVDALVVVDRQCPEGHERRACRLHLAAALEDRAYLVNVRAKRFGRTHPNVISDATHA